MPQILNPDIYKKAKADADKKYSKPSAYKSMYIVKRYKDLGGEYADDGKPKNLDRWRKEQWKDVTGLDYPVYRPTKRVDENTPLTPDEIEPENLVKQSILKQKIKGTANLPPFSRRVEGGKRTANEIKDFLEASYQDTPPDNLDGWVLDKSLSSKTAKVYYNPNTNEAVVAHRGTKGMLDWGNNLAYALGYYDYTQRYKQGKSVQDKAEKKYGKQNISTLGHSQGAILSRKLGADTKEVINVNPAWMGEKPKKNEYNIRSSTDLVSGLYAPISTASSVLFPNYTLKHDILVPSKKTTDIIGEHSYNILERLGDEEIGVGAENKISNDNIMKGGRRFSLDEKIKQLVYIGLPQEAVALLLHSGNLENVWTTYISGEDMTPVLSGILSSVEPRKTRSAKFELNTELIKDEDPADEEQTSDPIDAETGLIDDDPTDDDMIGGMRHYPYGHYNVGTNPIGVIGGRSKNPFRSVSKAFNKAGDAISKGLEKTATTINPMTYVLGSKTGTKVGVGLGDATNNYLLPATVSAGKPIYDATAITASTMLTGNPVLGKAVSDTLWNEMVAKQGYDPRDRQKSAELGELSGVAGQALAKPYSASLGGMGRKKTASKKPKKSTKSQEKLWDKMSRQYAHFKQNQPKSRVKDVMGFAKKMVRDKPNKKLVNLSKLFIKEFR
jgi:hypothetical protein